MFHLSKKANYGLLLLVELAHVKQESSSVVSLKEFAESRFMSFFFLQKAAYELRKSGIIGSERGKSGGYFLSREPESITLQEILETIEGPVSISTGLETNVTLPCSNEKYFTAHRGLNLLNHDLKSSLSRITLQDFMTPKTTTISQ